MKIFNGYFLFLQFLSYFLINKILLKDTKKNNFNSPYYELPKLIGVNDKKLIF